MSVGDSVSLTALQNGVVSQTVDCGDRRRDTRLFTEAGGTGQAAALNQDNSLNSDSEPCARGNQIVLYGTGDGTGAVTVTIGGEPAVVTLARPPQITPV